MDRKELEELVGESMEDMGLEEHVEQQTCGRCGKIVDKLYSDFLCFECDASRQFWQI